MSSPPEGTSTPTKGPIGAGTEANPPRPTRTHEVAAFDTLNSIALKYGMTKAEVVKLNKLFNTSVRAGQQLIVYEPAKKAGFVETPKRPSLDSGSRPSATTADFDLRTHDDSSEPRSSAPGLSTAGGEEGLTPAPRPSILRTTADRLAMNAVRLGAAQAQTRKLPFLVKLRQQRSKRYFFETGASGDKAAAASVSSTSPKNRSFLSHIPDELRVNHRDIFKEHVRYFINEQRNVLGELTLTPSGLIFEPELDDPMTKQLGLLKAQFQADLHNILDAQVVEASEILEGWRHKLVKTFEDKDIALALDTSLPSSRTGGSKGSSATSGGAATAAESEDDGKPRFLQLVVMAPSSTETGRIVYFLINRWSAEECSKKIKEWTTQLRTYQATHESPPEPRPHRSMKRQPLRAHSVSAITTPGGGPKGAGQAPKKGDLNKSAEELIEPTLNTVSVILQSKDMLRKLASYLPPRCKATQWNLVYSTQKHGISLSTFYGRVRRKGPTLILIEDEDGYVFGAFASCGWETQKGYFGTGESCLFTIYPSFNVYPWSGLNEYYQFAREDQIALGGGSGKFGLWLDGDFEQGTSAPCDTFLNSCLAGQEQFKCTVMECWSFAGEEED